MKRRKRPVRFPDGNTKKRFYTQSGDEIVKPAAPSPPAQTKR